MSEQSQIFDDKIEISVKTKEKTIYKGKASTFTSRNDVGIFDILPMHANFITLINDFIVLDKGLVSEQKIDLEKGLVFFRDNKVDVYVGI